MFEPRRRAHAIGKLQFWKIGQDELALKFPVDALRGRVAVGIGANPAIVVNRRVQRLSGISNVVS